MGDLHIGYIILARLAVGRLWKAHLATLLPSLVGYTFYDTPINAKVPKYTGLVLMPCQVRSLLDWPLFGWLWSKTNAHQPTKGETLILLLVVVAVPLVSYIPAITATTTTAAAAQAHNDFPSSVIAFGRIIVRSEPAATAIHRRRPVLSHSSL